MNQRSGIFQPPATNLQDNHILDRLPTAVCVCDMAGIIKRYNEKAVQLWGRRPQPGNSAERFCGSYKLYLTDGTN